MISSYFDSNITVILSTVASRNDRGTPTPTLTTIDGRIEYKTIWVITEKGTEEQSDAQFYTDVVDCPMSSELIVDSVTYKIIKKDIMKDFMNSHMMLYLK